MTWAADFRKNRPGASADVARRFRVRACRLALALAILLSGLALSQSTAGLAPDNPGRTYLPLLTVARSAPAPARPTQPQVGVNFIGFFLDPAQRGAVDRVTPFRQPDWIFADFQALGVHAYRQFPLADLLWDVVEQQDGRWRFAETDTVVPNPAFEPIVTLFHLQYASPTPPWERDPARFQKRLGPEAMDYLERVIARYGPFVRYWEIGNEMDHWRAADPGMPPPPPGAQPPLAPPGGYSPQEQGLFLAETAAFIRARDPDAIIVLPGLSAPTGYPVDGWLSGVLASAGRDWFDVVNYHYYGPWQDFCRQRRQLQAFLERHALADKPVWLTETGVTADPTLTVRTNYPNSPQAQAADIFRRLATAYALGDDLVLWHTYLDSANVAGNDWRQYGVRNDQAAARPSYHALRLLTQELLPLAEAEVLRCEPSGVNAFRLVRSDGQLRYVAWGAGSFVVPAGVSQMAGVVPDGAGRFPWQPVASGQAIPLSDVPVLLR